MSAISPKQSLQNYILATLHRSTTWTVLEVYEDGLKMVLKGCCGMEQQIQEYLTLVIPNQAIFLSPKLVHRLCCYIIYWCSSGKGWNAIAMCLFVCRNRATVITVNGDTETRFANSWPQLRYAAQTNTVAVWPFSSKTWAKSPIQETLNLKAVLVYQGKSMGSSAFSSTLENLDFCTHRISLLSPL